MLGALSLDFLDDAPASAEALAGRLVMLGLLSSEPPAGPEELGDAAVLYEAIDRSVRAAHRREPLLARDVATINSFAGDEPPTPVLRIDGSVGRTAADPVRSALAAIARDAIDTIARYASHLGVCEGARCGRVFLDLSRGRGRRWCSMARCGNRDKVAAFRRRRG